MSVVIYTDGACKGNPGIGGYGAVILHEYDDEEYSHLDLKEINPDYVGMTKLSGGYKHTTNNRMELMAVIAALSEVDGEGQNITVYSDSLYLVETINEGRLDKWIRRNFNAKKNKDLWMKVAHLVKKHNVKFVWVEGHSGNPYNEFCDKLANQACKSEELLSDVDYNG